MTAPKFVDELPPPNPGRRSNLAAILAALRARRGEWAEVARYPAARRSAASVRGSLTAKKHPDIEASTRKDGDEVVLYMRAVAADGQVTP